MLPSSSRDPEAANEMAGGWGSERLVRGTVVVPSAAYRGSGVEGGSYPFPPAGGQGCRQLVGGGGSCSSPPAGGLGQQAASECKPEVI